jgi:transcriptional regulator
MHPDRRFGWHDEEEMLAFLAERAFCSIFSAAGVDLHVFQAPIVVAGPRALRFHLARANRGADFLDRGRILLSCLGPDAYVSPDWYGTADQVPTWNYVAVEAEGPARRLDEDELTALLDDLATAHESRLAPKPAWTRAKMSQGRFEGMLKAIVGFELAIEELRGTRKLGQNKSAAEIDGAIEGLAESRHGEVARLMRSRA